MGIRNGPIFSNAEAPPLIGMCSWDSPSHMIYITTFARSGLKSYVVSSK